MATVETLAQVLEAVETDLPDSVIRRMLDTAEEDVRAILTTAQRALLPVVLWEGDLAPGAGEILFTSDHCGSNCVSNPPVRRHGLR